MVELTEELLRARGEAMRSMVSSAADLTEHRKTIAKYLKLLRKDRKYNYILFYDMATIRHAGRFLKTGYRKIMRRAHPNLFLG